MRELILWYIYVCLSCVLTIQFVVFEFVFSVCDDFLAAVQHVHIIYTVVLVLIGYLRQV